MIHLSFKSVQKLMMGLQLIDFEEFALNLKETIGADRDYARKNWSRFQENPFYYMYSRSPPSQGEGLFKRAMAHTAKEEDGHEDGA